MDGIEERASGSEVDLYAIHFFREKHGPGLPAATICHTHSKAAHMTGRLKQTHSHHALMCHYSLLDLCYMDVYLDFTIEPVNAA